MAARQEPVPQCSAPWLPMSPLGKAALPTTWLPEGRAISADEANLTAAQP